MTNVARLKLCNYCLFQLPKAAFLLLIINAIIGLTNLLPSDLCLLTYPFVSKVGAITES